MPEISKVPVWLDCDPGHDDAFAILFAAHHPAINLLGISTVFGNAPVEKTTENTISLLDAFNKSSIPVYKGASHAMARPLMHHPTSVHGPSGIDGTSYLPLPSRNSDPSTSAVNAMAAALTAQPKSTVCIVAIGALTNIALLFKRYPNLIAHIKMLSIMGGSFGGGFTDSCVGTIEDKERIGNFTPWAEFNILADPEAAQALFSNKELAPKTMLAPLDLTHQAIATKDVRDMLRYGQDEVRNTQHESTLREMLHDLLMYFADKYASVYGMSTGPPLHDPLAVAAVLIGSPHEIRFNMNATGSDVGETFVVNVITEGSYEDAIAGKCQTGRTTLRAFAPSDKGIVIPRSLDVAAFWRALEKCIQQAELSMKEVC